MKKFIAFSLFVFVTTGVAMPVWAEEGHAVQNVKTGVKDMSTGWDNFMDSTHAEMSKESTPVGHVAGLGRGSLVAARKTLYQAGAGAIELLTFWIPKKQPLIRPGKGVE